MDRRAALQMSLQSIMVFILAFIVMGILIGVINSIFDPVRQQVAELEVIEIDSGASFGQEPSRTNPVTIGSQRLNLDPTETKSIDVGVYNAHDYTLNSSNSNAGAATNSYLTFDIIRCRDFGNNAVDATQLPEMAALFEIGINDEVRPGEVRKFNAGVRDVGIPTDQRYNCFVEVTFVGDTITPQGAIQDTYAEASPLTIGQANFVLIMGDAE